MSQQSTAPNETTSQHTKDGFASSLTVAEAPIYHRYYHMFAKGELTRLAREAAREIGLVVGPPEQGRQGIEIMQNGWERSNYYVELRCWKV